RARPVVKTRRAPHDRAAPAAPAGETRGDAEVRLARADAALGRGRRAAGPLDIGGRGPGPGAVDVHDGDRRAEAREMPGKVSAEPPARAGDQNMLVVERVAHPAARNAIARASAAAATRRRRTAHSRTISHRVRRAGTFREAPPGTAPRGIRLESGDTADASAEVSRCT